MNLKPLLLSLAIALTACSSGPSDSEIQEVAKAQFAQANSLMSGATGVNMGELVEYQTKVLNKSQQGDAWLVETELTIKPKIDVTKATPEQAGVLMGMGILNNEPKKGTTTVKFVKGDKGDKGWMAVN